jgi:ribosomal protein S18 acetylase RimI-like enzyme
VFQLRSGGSKARWKWWNGVRRAVKVACDHAANLARDWWDIRKPGRDGMSGRAASGSKSPHSILSRPPLSDAELLREAVLESVRTSPDSFLTTEAEIEEKPPAYWKDQLGTSTWAVMEADARVVGIAAAKLPGPKDEDYASSYVSRFIEQVWIDPSMRGHGLGEHLVDFLIEKLRQDGIQQFYLWVFERNTSAIGLYERMAFKPTGRPSDLTGLSTLEVQYGLTFDSDAIDKAELNESAGARDRDWGGYGVTYRLLGREIL